VIDHPDELEVAVFDFTEAAKNAPVGIGLQILSDNTQWLISHLSLDSGHCAVRQHSDPAAPHKQFAATIPYEEVAQNIDDRVSKLKTHADQ
jgi:hypothetical protein